MITCQATTTLTLTATIKSNANLQGVEELEVGHYRIQGPAMLLRVRVQAPDHLTTMASIMLDGGRYEVMLSPLRNVAVHATCGALGCPERVRCDRRHCTGVGPDYTCRCGPDEARFDATVVCGGTRISTIPPGADHADVDLRCGDATIIGIWTGPAPCSVMVDGPVRTRVDSEADGRFVVPDLIAGGYFVHVVYYAPGTQAGLELHHAIRHAVLDPGQTVDLGTISLDTACLSGRIEADIPLVHAVVYAKAMRASALVSPDGTFELCHVPADTPITLTLRVPQYGSFEMPNKVTVGQPILWSLLWIEDHDDPTEFLDEFDPQLGAW